MQRLDWLVYSSDDAELRRKCDIRTRLASDDLHSLARRIDDHGLHLVIEDAVDLAFDLEEHHLPLGTLDARGLDALEIAVADPTAVLVTAGGIFIGDPISNDARWRQLRDLGRTRATLGSSGLSGRYLGLVATGPLVEVRFPPDGER